MSKNKTNLFTFTTKLFYEDINGDLTANGSGLDELLFPSTRSSLESEVQLDRYIVNPEGITFRQKDASSHVRPYKPGKGVFYTIPRSSEITPITEHLRDSVIAGAQSASFDDNNAELMTQIVRDHAIGYNKTRIKLALDTCRTGKFIPIDESGNALEEGSIDFGRKPENDIAYDFTATSADIDVALLNIYNAYRNAGGSFANICMLMGSGWLHAFSSLPNDTKALKRIAMVQSTTQTLNIQPPQFEDIQGLHVVGRYLIPGALAPVWILGYDPGMTWIQKVTDTKSDFMPYDELLCFSTNDERWSVFGGLDVLNDAGKIERTTGELTFDTFFENDPPTQIMRSQSRWTYIPGDINKVVRSTGTFA